jgi:hypothetical protein
MLDKLQGGRRRRGAGAQSHERSEQRADRRAAEEQRIVGMSIDDKDVRRANAEARFKKAEARAVQATEAKAEHDAAIVARDANTERLKALRLARDESDRTAALARPASKKTKARAPKP